MTELWYRFNVFAEKQFFENKDLVDGMIIPAHVIAYYEMSFPEFIKSTNLPFIIDPVSYVWDIGGRFITNENGELKKSYSKLVEKLDCKIGNLLGKYKLGNVAFQETDFHEFIECVLNFQLLNFCSKKPQRLNSIQRLKERIRLIEGQESVIEPKTAEPYALIPPYFYFSRVGEEGYDRTLHAAKYAKSSKFANRRIFPCLCMNRSVLEQPQMLNKILDDFKDFTGIVFWIDSFDENSATLLELENLTKFVNALHLQGKEVINLYGGYFSLLLHYAGMSKMSCGICYSSQRNVFSEIGGGGLPVRYYEPYLKQKIMPDVMLKLYSERPELFSCDCPICQNYSSICQSPKTAVSEKAIALKKFFVNEESCKNGDDKKEKCIIDWESSRLHFLNHRKKEQEIINNSTLPVILDKLKKDKQKLTRYRFDPFVYGFQFETIDYLSNWPQAIESSTG